MRWEYKTLITKKISSWRGTITDSETLEQELNALGRDGWELVSVVFDIVSVVAVLKRQK